MASIIKIKRSGTAGNPAILGSGELAYTYLTDNGINGGDRLYIGTGSENMSGNAAVHEVIGGRYYTRLVDATITAGTLTTNAKSIPILSATGTIDKWYVGNVYTHDNTISTTDTDGNLVLNPNGIGKVSIANTWTLPRSAGTSNYILKTNGSDTASWAEPKIYIGSTAVNLFNTTGTVTSLAVDISGNAATADEADKVTHALTSGTDVSFSAGSTYDGSASITINVSSTLDTITGRGDTTTNAISIGGLTIDDGTGSGYIFPTVDSPNAGYFLKSDGDGQLSWGEAAASLHIYGTTGDHALDLNDDTFHIIGGSTPITVAVTNDGVAKTTTATISISNASTSAKGLAQFNSDSFSDSSGTISIKSGGVSNAQLANSSFYIGTTSISLGNTSGNTSSLAVNISGKATTAGTADSVAHTLSAGTDIDFDAGSTYDGSGDKTLNVTSTLNTVVGRGSTTTTAITVGGLTISDGTNAAGTHYQFPTADGTANYFLKTDGSGTLSWAALNQSFYLGDTALGTSSGSVKSVANVDKFSGGNFNRNYVKVGDTGFGPSLGTTNSDSDVRIETGGSGTVSHTWKFTKDGTTKFNDVYTFPASAAGGTGYVLIDTAGNGTLAWTANSLDTVTDIGSTTTNDITVGSISASNLVSGRVPYVTTDGKLIDVSNFTWDNANQVLKIGAGGVELGGDAGYGYVNTPKVTNNSHEWAFNSDGTTEFNGVFTFPATAATSADQVLADTAGDGILSWVDRQIQADWTESDSSASSYINNKPTLATVATSGLYSDLSGTPTLATVATSGLYSDLSGTPTLATVATSGAYSDLTGTPTSITSFGITDGDPGTVLVTDGSGTFSFSSTVSGLTDVTIGDLQIHDDNTIEFVGAGADGDITLKPKGTGHISASSAFIRDVKDPEADQDAATKKYVDGIAQGIHTHDSTRVATSASLATITGDTVSYANGTSGVGATITLTTPLTMLDNVSLVNGDRILVKNEADLDGLGDYANGIYTWATGGVTLTRANDFNQILEVSGGDFVFVTSGTANGKTGWVQVNKTTGIGSGHPIDFRQFSGAGTYLAGNGLAITGNTFSVNVATSGGLEISNDDLQLKSTVAGNGLTYNNGVIDVVGTADKITVSANAITIASTYVGQNTITTLGTIATGTWHGDAIGSGYGGTGFSAYAKGDIIYASDTNTLSKLTAGTDGQVLQMNSSGLPVWATLDGGEYV